MRALSGKNLAFYTAPIAGYATIDGQDANVVDIPTIQAAIKAKFDRPCTRPEFDEPGEGRCEGRARPAGLDGHRGRLQRRYHGGPGYWRLAGACRQGLQGRGGHQRDGADEAVTSGNQVFYGSGASANAAKIAGYFGATAEALKSLPAGHVEVLLGTGSTAVPVQHRPGGHPAKRSGLDLDLGR